MLGPHYLTSTRGPVEGDAVQAHCSPCPHTLVRIPACAQERAQVRAQQRAYQCACAVVAEVTTFHSPAVQVWVDEPSFPAPRANCSIGAVAKRCLMLLMTLSFFVKSTTRCCLLPLAP